MRCFANIIVLAINVLEIKLIGLFYHYNKLLAKNLHVWLLGWNAFKIVPNCYRNSHVCNRQDNLYMPDYDKANWYECLNVQQSQIA